MWKGVNFGEATEEWSGGGASAARWKDGDDDGEAEGGGWPPSGKNRLDLEEDTSLPSFSCRQKAHILPPQCGCLLQYWMSSSPTTPVTAWPSSWSPTPTAAASPALSPFLLPRFAPPLLSLSLSLPSSSPFVSWQDMCGTRTLGSSLAPRAWPCAAQHDTEKLVADRGGSVWTGNEEERTMRKVRPARFNGALGSQSFYPDFLLDCTFDPFC